MNKLIIAVFPMSAFKFMVQNESGQFEEPKTCWLDNFESLFQIYMNPKYDIKEIYVLGPKTYISKFVSVIKNKVNIPVFEEGM